MVGHVIDDFNIFEKNKKLLTGTNLYENSSYVVDKEYDQLMPEKFNQEAIRVKEKFQNEINKIISISSSSTCFVNHYSLKEEEIINKNKYAINTNNARILEKEISQIQQMDSQVNSRSDSNANSLHDFFKEVKDSIVTGKNDYLDVLKDVFSNYMKFVNELREILASISQYVSAGSDDNHINFKRKDFYKKIKDFIDKYSSRFNEDLYLGSFVFKQDSDGHFYREINGERIYANGIMVPIDAIEDLLKEIKGGKVSINQLSSQDMEYEIHFKVDLSSFNKLLDLVLDGTSEDEINKASDGSDVKLLSSEFNLLKNGIDAFEKNINTNLDELSKKYSAANSNYDNFVKIVSSTMNTLLEMAKGFLRF
ncbi:IpaD/SipD/SspD family type III secretion system needle tip protein [Proteus faecis]|uniref:IpaD/SipD/SspD family type III secretion system needle tip protein n=1 Tax=Proteus faecis TaxID=2050967 RepID=UPI000D698E0F|nr:IpaD/SipD/SspD family type III secretion system needle tip protein [Proteus faecis]